jgi:hypothetical protein
VIDPIKEFLQININHDSASGLYVGLRTDNGFLCAAPRSETKAVLAKGRVQQRLQDLQQRLLDQSIRHRRNAQLTLATIRFRNRHPSYRTRPVRPLQELITNHRPRRSQVAGGLGNIPAIHASRAFVGPYPLPRLLQVLSRQRCHQQR